VRILKLAIWDLDETLLTGIYMEGDRAVAPAAADLMTQLAGRGVLQALATQNPPELMPGLIQDFGWSDSFVQVEADLGPKARKIRRILESLEVNPQDVAFIDQDAFERDSIAVQFPGVTSWSVSELDSYVSTSEVQVTEEGRRRPQMYREQQVRAQDEAKANDYEAFLRACNIGITIRPYLQEDAARAEELIRRTHQMNLGVLPVEEAVARLNQRDAHSVVIAEMNDVYGDMGRCGILHLTPDREGEALIESLAISCRTRARGLSLAMLVGLLTHANAHFDKYRCRYVFNGSNRPLRMLLMGAGFKSLPDTDELTLSAHQLAQVELPDWVKIRYEPRA
jgi:methoxymalonate biosynthesis protein